MDSWMIGARLVILLYCVLHFLRGDMESIPLVLLMLLVYISFAVLFYIFDNPVVRRCSRIISIVILAAASIAAEPSFLLLISVDILELLSEFTDNWKICLFFIAIPSVLAGKGQFHEYIAFSLLVLLIYLLAANHFRSFSELKKINESLRDRNEELICRLDAGNEYEAQMRYLSQIEERNSLAQKIHDKVGHTLAGSIIQLEAAGLILEKDREKAGEIVRNVTENLKDGMDSIRTTLRTIKPPAEQLGINRLKLILEEFSMNHSIKTFFSYTGNLDVVSNMQWKIIIDNLKESLTNALKYSSATRIDVRLEVMNRLIKSEVIDNGIGALTIKKGMGLSGMEERTENAGGKLILDGSSGFSVITLLPAGPVNAETEPVDAEMKPVNVETEPVNAEMKPVNAHTAAAHSYESGEDLNAN